MVSQCSSIDNVQIPAKGFTMFQYHARKVSQCFKIAPTQEHRITSFLWKNRKFIRNSIFSMKVVWELVFEGVTRFGHRHFVAVHYNGA